MLHPNSKNAVSSEPATDVLIVGAGPVGLVAAARLRQLGVSVRVVEAGHGPAEDLRASTLHPATLEMLDELDLLKDLLPQGLKAPEYQYRVRSTNEIFSFDLTDIADLTRYPYRLQCEQYKITGTLRDRLDADDGCDLRFGRRALSFEQDDNGVRLFVETAIEVERYDAKFMIACDGGSSVIRKWMGTEFDGFTYPEKFLSMSTLEPLEEYFPNLSYVNYISDPKEWLVILRAPSAWRVLVPADDQTPDAELVSDDSKVDLFKRLIGKPETDTVHRTVYRVHQRVAKSYYQDRVILAGDSAHLNNPLGGLGMNSGIHDAWNLTPRLARIIQNNTDHADEIAHYERQRQFTMRAFIQSQTIQNKEMMEANEADAQAAHQAAMRAINNDDAKRRDFMIRQSMIESLKLEAQVA